MTLAALALIGLLAQQADPTPSPTPSEVEDSLFGDAPKTDSDIEKKLSEACDPLAIGGRLYLRLQYSALETGDAEDFPLASPNLLDVYLDARPSDRLRAFAQARLLHDFTLQEGDTNVFGQETPPTRVQLDQLWVKFDIQRRVFLSLGKQRIKWGAGRIWNPTDFLNNQRRDPLALFDERLGVALVKVHLPIEARGWNVYAIANLDDAKTPQAIGAALRAEVLIKQTEISLSGAVRDGTPQRLGADVSSALGPFDVHVEGAVTHLLETPFYRGTFDPENSIFPEEFSRRDDWIGQIAGGADIQIRYNDEDSVILGAEYFYNDAGYDDPDLYPWLLLNGTFVPFYTAQHYGSVFALLQGPGQWDQTRFLATVIGNLSDNSYVGRLDYGVRFLNYIDLSVFTTWHFGSQGEFHFEVDYDAIPGVPGLENGLKIPAPLVEAGVWLSLSI